MSENTGKKKYSLVVEPYGSYDKYVVYFEYVEGKGYQFNKKAFKSCAEISGSKKGKYSLLELDIFTSEMFKDNYDLFRKLGLYQQVHNVYIQFSGSKGRLKRLAPIYDEDLVIDKLGSVKNDKIVDENQIVEYIHMLLEDRMFVGHYLDSSIYKTKTVDYLVREMVKISRYVNQTGGSDESRETLYICKQKLKEELSKYHIFRGFVLAEDKTIQAKKEKEEKQLEIGADKPKVYIKRPTYPGYEPQVYNQIKLDGFGDED